MNAPEHSPLPWRDDGYGIADANNDPAVIYGDRGKELANRQLIIRAVNSHDALINAAKDALEALSIQPPWPNARRAAIANIRAAIAAVEELAS